MKDLTKNNPARVMFEFMIPVALGNMFQLFYSLADTRVVGSTLGEAALASVGATTSISTLFIGFLSGLASGFSILIARYFGAKKNDEVRYCAAGSLALGILTSIILTLLCILSLPQILHILNVPPELFPNSISYIRIVILGLAVTMLYNTCAAILRAIGDTVAPLLFLILASILNVGLDFLLIMTFHMGVAGAALATVIAQSISAILSLFYMIKHYPLFRFKITDLKKSFEFAKGLYKSGLSMAAMMSLVFFGTLALQCSINTFGQDIIVAHTAARKITEFFMLPFSVMGVTMATYCSQNMGANNIGRIRSGIIQALAITWIWSLFMILLSYTAVYPLIYLVTGTHNETILHTAALYLRFDTLFYFAPAAIAVLRNALQGIGDHKTPVFSSFIELIGKVVAAIYLAKLFNYWGIIVAEPLVWVLMVIPLIVQIKKLAFRR